VDVAPAHPYKADPCRTPFLIEAMPPGQNAFSREASTPDPLLPPLHERNRRGSWTVCRRSLFREE
jgi:hypothetical protein